ncbi:MAG: transcriptional regulator [Candidatus Cloacimonetes bacterium]|nr:transcriptional regulator [Candidatus Cloacimonadota bacterium]
MILLITPSKAQKILAENTRLQRLDQELTQEGLALRSGVPLATLRKFEQKGIISFSIDEVVKANTKVARKRGRRK